MPQALPANLEIEFAGKASSHYVYGTEDATCEIEADDYFLPVANRFIDLAGQWRPDRIMVVRDLIAGGGNGYEIADFVVAYASPNAVRITRLGRWRSIGKGPAGRKPAKVTGAKCNRRSAVSPAAA